MAAPKWITPTGDLGTIQEMEFYELSFKVIVPDDPKPLIRYKVIAGSLPPGLIMSNGGYLAGRPKDIYRIRGVPFDVAQDTKSVFCVRATNTKTGQVTDRTFSITVTGQDAPSFVTPGLELGTVFDGTYAEFPITVIDLDNEPLYYAVTKGSLPSGLSLDRNTGIISGFVEPTELLELGSKVGWSADATWDDSPWDFGSRATSKRFEFDVTVTDNKEKVTRTFSIFVLSKDSLTADNSLVNVNGYYDTITADLDNKRDPVLLTPSSDLGMYSHDNYFAYQLHGRDFDNDAISFSLLIGDNIGYDNENNGFDSTLLDAGEFELPPDLDLGTTTGWLYGNLKAINAAQREYTFGVRVYKTNYPTYSSKITYFTVTIVGDLRNVVSWVTPTNVGTILTGSVSDFEIKANNTLNAKLLYTLVSGKLPQGLKLLDNGLIIGRPSFEITKFDKGRFTLDKNIREMGQFLEETTFDRSVKFRVKASDIDGKIAAYKDFKMSVADGGFEPYESLYLRAYPGAEDKEIYNQIVFSTDIIPENLVYRNGDPYFGRQRNLETLVLSGINPSTGTEYIQAMAINHYRKRLLLGEPSIAQALDENGNVKYEVLYIPLKDDEGTTSKSIDLRNKISKALKIDNANPSVDDTYVSLSDYDRVLYPNSLTSMRSQIRNFLGLADREMLPLWMTSKQKDGKILYWTPAAVLAYLVPGAGEKVKFLFNRIYNLDIKDISFDIDRYVWDRNLSAVFDSTTDSYLPSFLTTFDRDIRTGNDTLNYAFNGDGSTTSFDMFIPIETGIITVTLERYLNPNEDGSTLVLDRSLQIEGVDYTRSNNFVIFNVPPAVGNNIVVNYRRFENLSVDYGLTTPFDTIDGMSYNYITNVLGGLDFSIDVYEGKRVIFIRQEQYPGYIKQYDGWIRNISIWDNGIGWDDPSIGFDDYEIIPGYTESQADPEVNNERAGVYLITKDSVGNYHLELETVIQLNQKVFVRYGSQNGGKLFRLGPTVQFEFGETVPRYNAVSAIGNGIETTFDGGYTRFVNNISVYEDPDVNDKYLAFPRRNIFA